MRIRIEQAQVGMFVHELCGPWFKHSFWRTRFLLNSSQELERLRGSPIEHLWIDTSKGLSPADMGAAPALAPALAPDPQPTALHTPDAAQAQASEADPAWSQELEEASYLCVRAGRVLQAMFSDIRLGRPVERDSADRLVQQLQSSIARNPHALISLARLKTADNYSYMHSLAVCALMMALAQRMQLSDSEVRMAGLAGMLHDVGKCRVPLRILNKPGALTPQEWRIMQDHALLGAQLLKQLDVPAPVLQACLQHHEKMDGTGYPQQLQGAQIDQLARMAAICDVYDAVTSDRPYKKGWPPAQALQRMAQWCGSHLDKTIFEQFVQTVGIYPMGSLVRLSTEQLAIVISPTSPSLLHPRVRVFYCLSARQPVPHTDLDLDPDGVHILSREDPEAWQDWDLGDLHAVWQSKTQLPTISSSI